ncbi:Asp-tRNA(Asn)/Glu-tRNA(Gln) amidotransferase subunit GatA [uncultured Anaerococcus sp.]|uniref:Asp-tRNA(Asn)/Glu-tRNA(Gln) amidotransferase subunit GatA n=1 Tax=uncultured Anaerococcus sp. TaxID=293428 RepID=UPI00288B0B99|nr:Asp-tRNA(Asn)/Glu-tRNA(Gln) amidotransferase subunit GatA [uncultured Anaerococcus sp.]
MNIKAIIEKYKNQEISVEENTKNILEQIKKDQTNAYITFDEEDSLNRAKQLDQKLAKGEKLGSLFGIAVAVKDNISYKNMNMTCASKMLKDFRPMFDAKVVENLLNEDAIIIAKTNMDEFAMGGRGKTSFFGPVKNPIDETRVTGGSSSGSAAAVAKDDVLVALGTDTGGSVRCPASYCNILGYKPTYSMVSRNGVVSMANTLDQVSVFGKNVEDIRTLAQAIEGPDANDMTVRLDDYKFEEESYDFKGKKIAYISADDEMHMNIDPTVEEDYKIALGKLEKLGADLCPITLKYSKYANPVYNVVMSSEVSSNMSRFDGIRFGYQSENYTSVDELFINSRSEGLGEEVQRRIALGTMYLSADDNQRVYRQGLKLRTLIKQELEDVFKANDLIITPTVINLPPALDDDYKDPLSDFKSDGFNVIVNLAGMCGLSLPVRKGISGSVQFIANANEDSKLLNAGEEFMRRINEK